MKKTISVLCVAALLAPSLSFGHSGGLDANGCHAGTEPYHCHHDNNDDDDDKAASNLLIALVVLGVAAWYLHDGNDQQGSSRGRHMIESDQEKPKSKWTFEPVLNTNEEMESKFGFAWKRKF